MLNWLGMPPAASAHAGEIDQMMVLVHWLMLVLFVGWGAFFVFVLVRFRAGANPKASYVGAKGKLSKSLEVAVAIIEVVLLVFYAIPAWAKRVQNLPAGKRSRGRARRRRAVRVEHALSRAPTASSAAPTSSSISADNPLGLDRNDPDAKDDITDINQLHVPVNRPVLVHLTSKDVIHSFGLYEMRIKQDADTGPRNPGLVRPHRDDRRDARQERQGRLRLRDRLLAAVRPRPLPHARLRHRAERCRLRDVDGRAGQSAREVAPPECPALA